MNKKLLLGAALLGLFGTSLTSCVDSTESASVTAIREAKAEQLKSIAALNNALAKKEADLAAVQAAAQKAEQAYMEAQAAKLASDAKYAEAQAEYMKAQAEYMSAQAAYYAAKTENEKELLQIELQERQKQLEVVQANLDRMAQELEYSKAHLEAMKNEWAVQLQNLQAQADLMKINVATAQHNYDMMIKAAQEAEDAKEKAEILAAAQKVKECIDAYNNASEILVDANVRLETAKLNKSRIESGLENQKNIINEDILSLKDDNTYVEGEIAKKQAIIDAYKQYVGQEVTPEMVFDANLDVVKAQVAMADYQPTLTEAYQARNEAYSNMWSSRYIELVNELLSPGISSGSYHVANPTMERRDTYYYKILGPSNDSSLPNDCKNKYYLDVWTWVSGSNFEDNWDWKGNNVHTYTPIFDNMTSKLEELESGDSYWTYETLYNLVNDGAGLNAWLDCKLAQLRNGTTNVTTLKEDLVKAKEYLTKANQNLATAKQEFGEAETALATAKQEMDEAKAIAEESNDNVTEARNTYEEKERAYLLNPTEENKTAMNEALDAYNAAVELRDENWSTYLDKNSDYRDAVDEKNNKENAKNEAISRVDYATAWISILETDIRRAEAGNDDNATQVAYFKDLVKEIIAEAANNVANVTAYNEAYKNLAEKEAAYGELQYALSEAEGKAEYLSWIVANNNGIEGGNETANALVVGATQAIEFYQQRIDLNNQQIAEWEKALAAIDTDPDNQVAILEAQAAIEKAQIALTTAQQLYDIAKAELDAALAEQK